MIFGLWFSDFYVELTETFQVPNNGAEVLTEFLQKLFTGWHGLYCRGEPWLDNPDHHLRPWCTLMNHIPTTADSSQIHYVQDRIR
jgi:hypothetical protein